MHHRVLLLLFLIFSRVFVAPVWFSIHASKLRSSADTFEQVRLKKRRSSFLEEEQISNFFWITEAEQGNISEQRFFFKTNIVQSFSRLSSFLKFPVFNHSLTYLIFLRNRVLRI